MPADIQGALERRRGDVSRVESMSVQRFAIEGFQLVAGSGEAAFEVNFPVWFDERPCIVHGYELADSSTPEATNFPLVSAGVIKWHITERGGFEYYTGATMGVVALGKANQEVWVHWQATGKALRNPLGSEA